MCRNVKWITERKHKTSAFRGNQNLAVPQVYSTNNYVSDDPNRDIAN